MPKTIAVNELRVGMYVQLDIGWMRHPFPLSSFRIETAAQIDTIRGLGLRELRWDPDKSLIVERPAAVSDEPTAAIAAPSAPIGAGGESTAPPAPVETAAMTAARQRREDLVAQHARTERCEHQCAEARAALQATLARVHQEPEAAHAEARALSRAIVDKLIGDDEIGIRLLTTQAGDMASAHALNVGLIALLMGRRLSLPADELTELGVGAMLHDVGKLDLPAAVRDVDERFSPPERALYQNHVSRGVTHGRRMGLSATALSVLAQHHELADGSGFPGGLGVEQMTPAARIVALVNRYDNLCNPPHAARALTPHQALSQLFAQQRDHFDGAVLNAFIRMMGVYPAGSLVQLTDDRYALVVEANSTRPLKPRVLVHDVRIARDEALILDLESMPNLGIRRSLIADKLPQATLDYLAPRTRVSYYFEVRKPAAQPA